MSAAAFLERAGNFRGLFLPVLRLYSHFLHSGVVVRSCFQAFSGGVGGSGASFSLCLPGKLRTWWNGRSSRTILSMTGDKGMYNVAQEAGSEGGLGRFNRAPFLAVAVGQRTIIPAISWCGLAQTRLSFQRSAARVCAQSSSASILPRIIRGEKTQTIS